MAAPGTLGSLVVQLELDGAEFHRNVGKAREGIRAFAEDTASHMRAMTAAVRDAQGAMDRLQATVAASRSWGAQQAQAQAVPMPPVIPLPALPSGEVAAALQRWEASTDRVTASTQRLNAAMASTRGLGVASTVAARGLGGALESIIPAAAGAEFYLGRVVHMAAAAGPVAMLAAKAFVGLGLALLAYKGIKFVFDITDPSRAVEALQEETQALAKWAVTANGIRRREARAAAEETKKKYDELRKIREQADDEELKKLQGIREAEAKLTEDLVDKLAASRATLTAQRLAASGDELGAERVASDERIRLLDKAHAAAEKNIEADVVSAAARNAALLLLDQAYLNDRAVETEKSAATLRAIEDQRITDATTAAQAAAQKAVDLAQAAAQRQAQLWQQETAFLIGQLNARLAARKAFEQQLGTGAAGLGVKDSSAQGLKRLTDARENLQKGQRDIAFQQREGFLSPAEAIREQEKLRNAYHATLTAIQADFKAVPPVVAAVQRAIDSIDNTVFVAGMKTARSWVAANITTLDGLRTGLDDLNRRLTSDVPAAVDTASAAVGKLIDDYTDLAWAVYAASQQIQAQNTIRSAAAPKAATTTTTESTSGPAAARVVTESLAPRATVAAQTTRPPVIAETVTVPLETRESVTAQTARPAQIVPPRAPVVPPPAPAPAPVPDLTAGRAVAGGHERIAADVARTQALRAQLDDLNRREGVSISVSVPGAGQADHALRRLGDAYAYVAESLADVNEQLAEYNRLAGE